MPYSTACKTLSLTSLSKNDGSCSSGCDWADKKKIVPAYSDHRHPVDQNTCTIISSPLIPHDANSSLFIACPIPL